MARNVATWFLLLVPVALAFRSGGYFPEPRLIAAIFCWLLVLGSILMLDGPLCRGKAPRVALAGLCGLVAVVALSLAWTPLAAGAWSDLGRIVGYLGAFVAGLALLRGRFGMRSVEASIAGGALLVSLYALSGKVLPGIVHQQVSLSAGGRIDQPLTYWNAVGAYAGVGLVLGARIAADHARDRTLAIAAGAGTVPVALVTYLTFSRGALLVVFVGFAVVILISRSSRTAEVTGALLVCALPPCVAATLLESVRTGLGSPDMREVQGVAMIAVTLTMMIVAGTVVWALRRRPEGPQFRLRAGLAVVGALAVTAVFIVAAAGGGNPVGGKLATGADSRRLVSVESNRYQYWVVAGRMFARKPFTGEGSGAFRVVWRRERTVEDRALDAHSLYVETAAELGLLGIAALVLLLAGGLLSVVRAVRQDRALAAGPAAALLALAIHAGLDWDWEMPTLALSALLLLAALAGGTASQRLGRCRP